MSLMSLLIESTIKGSLIVLPALVAVALLRKRSAAVRHRVLSVAIAGAAAMPLLAPIVPSWHLPLAASSPAAAIRQMDGLAAGAGTPRADAVFQEGWHPPPSATPAETRTASMGRLLQGAWIAGAVSSLLILFAGLARLSWLASRAERVRRRPWVAVADDISRAYGLRRPVVLLQSRHPTLLVTWGFVRPKVILPVAASKWPADRIRVVLCHELAHVRRGDWLAQITAELLRAVYWFNPLLWIACRRLRVESEQACDDEVLNRGVGGLEYATELLDLARALRQPPRTWFPAPAMARPSSLERRITAMLNVHLSHRPLTRTARALTALAILSLAVPLAGLSQAAPATLSGSVHDPAGVAWSGVTLALTHTGSGETFSTRSGEAGTFEFTGLPSGEYRLDARLPGFASLEETVTLAAGRHVHRKISLELGSVQETATAIKDDAAVPTSRDTSRAQEMIERFRGRPLQPPVKVHHVQAVYPQALRGTGIEGEVVLEGSIATDGLVKIARLVAPVHPDSLAPVHPELAQAAVEAVRQWRFEPTRLHGTPVETRITVRVSFKAD
jgi:TonB family protein